MKDRFMLLTGCHPIQCIRCLKYFYAWPRPLGLRPGHKTSTAYVAPRNESTSVGTALR